MKQQFLTCFFTQTKSKSSSPLPSQSKKDDYDQTNSYNFSNNQFNSINGDKQEENKPNQLVSNLNFSDFKFKKDTIPPSITVSSAESFLKAQNEENKDNAQENQQKQKQQQQQSSDSKEIQAKKSPLPFPQIILKKLDDDDPLGYDFYQQDVVTLARELIGKIMVRKLSNGGVIKCMIVETEAYKAPLDKACHAYNNKKTERTKYFWLPGGRVYMFTIYRTAVCFNIVAGKENEPEAVLLRAVEPIDGLALVHQNRGFKSKKNKDLTNGPGKLTQAMQIGMDFNGYDLTNKEKLYLVKGNYSGFEVQESKRINIDYAGPEWADKLWRFTMRGNQYVSVNK